MNHQITGSIIEQHRHRAADLGIASRSVSNKRRVKTGRVYKLDLAPVHELQNLIKAKLYSYSGKTFLTGLDDSIVRIHSWVANGALTPTHCSASEYVVRPHRYASGLTGTDNTYHGTERPSASAWTWCADTPEYGYLFEAVWRQTCTPVATFASASTLFLSFKWLTTSTS